MTPAALNERLAHLLQVQGGLLDAYLEQNLGRRYAYAIVVWEQGGAAGARGVTNVRARGELRHLVREADRIASRERVHATELDRSPLFVDAGEVAEGD